MSKFTSVKEARTYVNSLVSSYRSPGIPISELIEILNDLKNNHGITMVGISLQGHHEEDPEMNFR